MNELNAGKDVLEEPVDAGSDDDGPTEIHEPQEMLGVTGPEDTVLQGDTEIWSDIQIIRASSSARQEIVLCVCAPGDDTCLS